jgi:O-antigen/teichoic acid export membrane protein
LVIVNIVSIFLMGILYWILLYGSPLKTTVLLKDLVGLLGYTIPFVAVNNLCEVTTALANWEKNYRLLSTATFVRGSCTVGFQIVLGLILPTAGSLVIGRTVGDLSFVVLLLIVRRKDWRLFLSPISLHDIVHTAVQYKRYPLYTIPSEWAQKASTELPTWLILLAFGDTIAGYYNITTRVLTGPASLLVAGIRAFLFRKYAEVWSQGRKIDQVFAKSVALLFLVFFAIMFVAFIFAPQICDIFLGQAWLAAVPYLRILAPLTLVSMLVGATGMIVHVLKLQRFLMAWSILALFATTGVLLLGFVIHDPLLVIGLMAGSNFGIYLIYIGYTFHASQRLDPLNSYQPI